MISPEIKEIIKEIKTGIQSSANTKIKTSNTRVKAELKWNHKFKYISTLKMDWLN